MDQIARHVDEEMRSIDEMGWLDRRSIGVLLPSTGLRGAQRFASRVSDSLLRLSPRPPWKAFTYPSEWFPRNGGSGNGDRDRAFSSGGEGQDRSPRPPRPDWISDVVGSLFSFSIPAWKRWFDVILSTIFIILSSPLLLVMAMYIKCVSPGRILFKQDRVGYRGKVFSFLKFRTMHENSNPGQHREYLRELIKGGKPMEKLDGGTDTRIIPGGRILRKACLDELPQLFNVLRGDMSLVGPRPCIPYEAQEYLRWHTHRFDIQPGMTGLWQVSGKNKLSFAQMVRLDITYARNMSILLDLKILFLTIPTIIGLIFEAGLRRMGIGTAPTEGRESLGSA